MLSLIKIKFFILLLIDFILSAISINISSFIRLGDVYSANSLETLIAAIIVPSTFFIFQIYKTSWRYFSLLDMWRLIRICLVANIFIFICIFILNRLDMTPRLVIVLNFFSLCFLTCGARIVYRSLFERFFFELKNKSKDSIPVMLIGSEENAESFIRGTERKNSAYKVINIVSNNHVSNKSYFIRGVPVLGNIKKIKTIIEKLKKNNDLPHRLVIISNNLQSKEMSELMQISEAYGMKLGRAPFPGEVIDDNKNLLIREVSLEDLLGRRQNRLNNNFISRLISNNTVFITGAGGSIGSQLSKKIVILNPKKLVLIDVSENAIYNLKYFFRDHSYLNKITFSCSNIRNKNEMEKLFDRHKPDIIFHAGALKHVTICEENISEAIRTNVIATSMLANLAEKFSSKCFVLISTDKAVEPTSVMGLTKKMAEIVIKSKDKLGEKNTRFIVVRFGNVLGSTGSVIPLFKKQLSNGGPLTVTDKKVTRFFMTIDEAVNLVMHASSESVFKPSIPAGCINVLNMGESIKIDDLAKQVIRLSGLEPIKDIQIKYTGLKQGEKLYEKLYANDEEKIKEGMQGYFLVNSNKTNKIDASTILEELESLCVQDNNNIRNDLFKVLEKK